MWYETVKKNVIYMNTAEYDWSTTRPFAIFAKPPKPIGNIEMTNETYSKSSSHPAVSSIFFLKNFPVFLGTLAWWYLK